MEQLETGNDPASAQSRVGEAEANLTERLGTWQGGFAGFISECESLQRDLERNPYNAEADHERVKLLIEIAKKWHGGYGARADELQRLRAVYEAARRVLRFNGIDRDRTIAVVDEMDDAIERVKSLDSGLEDEGA